MYDWQSPDTAAAVAAAMRAADAGVLAARAVTWDDTSLRFGGSIYGRESVARIHVVAAGKAAAAMAGGAVARLRDEVPVAGTILGVQGDRRRARQSALRLEWVRPRGWNLPTAQAVLATRRVLDEVGRLADDTLLLVLLTGGASAMLCAPRAPVTLEDSVAATLVLVAHGASIDLLNAVRRRISDVKGGGLLRAARGAYGAVGLLVSDVDDDDPAVIGSGPLVPLRRRGAEIAGAVRALGAWEALPATVRAAVTSSVPDATSGAPCHVIGGPGDALHAAVTELHDRRRQVLSLGRLSGPADDVAEAHVRAARALSAPSVGGAIVSIGESTVRLPPGGGNGGRAAHLALAMAVALDADAALTHRFTSTVVATDGEDGQTARAGAMFRHEHIEEAGLAGFDPADVVTNCESGSLSHIASNVTERTGRTNVQDLRVVLIDPAPDDRARWDSRHAGPEYRRDGGPSAFLAQIADRLPTAGHALDVACGDGGDAVFLAERGLHVTAVDISPVALEKVRALAEARGVSDRIETREVDLTQGILRVPWIEGGYDVITLIHFRDRTLLRGLARGVARHGWLVVETATTENLLRGLKSPGARWLAEPSEVVRFGSGQLTVRLYREDEIDGMVRAQLLAENAPPWDYPEADDGDDDEEEDDGDEE